MVEETIYRLFLVSQARRSFIAMDIKQPPPDDWMEIFVCAFGEASTASWNIQLLWREYHKLMLTFCHPDKFHGEMYANAWTQQFNAIAAFLKTLGDQKHRLCWESQLLVSGSAPKTVEWTNADMFQNFDQMTRSLQLLETKSSKIWESQHESRQKQAKLDEAEIRETFQLRKLNILNGLKAVLQQHQKCQLKRKTSTLPAKSTTKRKNVNVSVPAFPPPFGIAGSADVYLIEEATFIFNSTASRARWFGLYREALRKKHLYNQWVERSSFASENIKECRNKSQHQNMRGDLVPIRKRQVKKHVKELECWSTFAESCKLRKNSRITRASTPCERDYFLMQKSARLWYVALYVP